jgi:hypothetical protein
MLQIDYAPVAGDVLYGIELRPQELLLYGDEIPFQLRYAPIFEDPAAVVREHYKLLVLECIKTLPPDLAVGRTQAMELRLMKVGWQLQVTTAEAIRCDAIGESPGEVPFLLARIAETVNGLAQKAGVDAPMPEGVVARLGEQYRRYHG